MAKQELRVDITGDSRKLQTATKKADKNIASFDKSLSKLGGTIALAFGTRELVSFGVEAVKLAAKMEGVERAFQTLSGTSLPELQRATRGTVDNMRLMQAAVNARNFRIPLEQLGGFFEFATKRANETGQSVDYLVNSIVTGIGRKSPLILDNLGISAVELRKKLKGIGIESATTTDIAAALNEVIQEQQRAFGDNGEQALTSGQKIEKLSATWANLKVNIGQAILEIEESTGILESLNSVIQTRLQRNEVVEELEKVGVSSEEVSNIFRKARKEDLSRAETVGLLAKRLEEAKQKQKEFNDFLDEMDKELGLYDYAADKTKEIVRLTEDQKKILEQVSKAQNLFNIELEQFGSSNYDKQINTLKNAIIALVDSGLSPANAEIKRLRGELNALQSESLKAMGLSMETEFKDGAIADFNKEFNELRKNTSQLENSLLAETAGWDISDYMPEETAVDPVMEKMSRFKEIINEIGFSWENVGNQFTSTFSSMLSQGTLTFRGLAAEVGKLITRLLTQLALQVAIRALFGDVSAGARAAAGVESARRGFSPTMNVPELANGGIATSPTLAMIGEGRESEAILPLSKLEGLMSGGYGGGQELVSRISGDDLLLMLRRASNSSNRNGSLGFSI